MNDNHDDAILPDRAPDPTPDPLPVVPRKRHDGDDIKGPVFSFSSENLHLFCDKAVTDPAELAAFRKPPRG